MDSIITRVHPCHIDLFFLLERLKNRLAQLLGGFLLPLVALHQFQVSTGDAVKLSRVSK